MKITADSNFTRPIRQDVADLITGKVVKLASKQVDNVDEINFKEMKANHRISFQYHRELGKNVAHVIDNASNETVKVIPTETQVDHMLRMNKLMGLHIDEKA